MNRIRNRSHSRKRSRVRNRRRILHTRTGRVVFALAILLVLITKFAFVSATVPTAAPILVSRLGRGDRVWFRLSVFIAHVVSI